MRIFRFLPIAVIAVAILVFVCPLPAQVSVGISVHVGPPPLPVYAQPICPGAGYIWTPGYWAYGDDGYYWVPGTWVLAPHPGLLWTPGYWGWAGGAYIWHAGYWGPHVGFYGGINYGFGYTGVGYAGGYWHGGVFFYNRSVSHVNVTIIHNTYNRAVVVNNVHTSFNGGHGGIMARPTAADERYSHEEHMEATHEQVSNREAAGRNRAFLASENHGHPAVAATARPGEFSGHGVEASRGAMGVARPEARGGNEHNARPAAAPRQSEHVNAPRGGSGNRGEEKHANAPRQESKPHAQGNPHNAHEPKQEKHPHR